jgi:predicted nucleic acid-binding protein
VIRLVVDASVAVKWLFEEAGSSEAAALRDPSYDLFAPDLMRLEVANVVWHRVQLGTLPIDAGRTALQTLGAAPVRMRRTQTILEAAWEIAVRMGRTIYDSLYLALAVALDGRVITADRRLHDAIARSDLFDRVLWIEDLSR